MFGMGGCWWTGDSAWPAKKVKGSLYKMMCWAIANSLESPFLPHFYCSPLGNLKTVNTGHLFL